MLKPAFLLSCLLLTLVSSAPFPTVVESPSSVVVEVKQMKTNVTLSFTIFITQEAGSGAGEGGRSDDNTASSESDDTSSEETIQPMGSLLAAETQPMTVDHTDHGKQLSSEEMMSDQPMFTMSDDEADVLNNISSREINMKHKATPSDTTESRESHSHSTVTVTEHYDDRNNPDELKPLSDIPVSRELNDQGYVDTFSYFDDKNSSRSDEFTDITNNKETTEPTFPPDDNKENMNDEGYTATLDSYDDNDRRSDEPTSNFSNDLSNFSSSEVSEPDPNLQGVLLNTDNRSSGGDQQGTLSDDADLDPESQGVTSSSSEKMSTIGQGSITFHKVFHSIQKIVHLLSGNKGQMGAKGHNYEVLGSVLSSEESDNSESDPNNHFVVGSSNGSDESLEETSSNTQKGTSPRDSTGQVPGPTTSPVSSVMLPDPDSEVVLDISAGSTQADKRGSVNMASSDQGLAPTMWTMLKDAVSQQSSKSLSWLNADSSEDSQESVGTQDTVGSDPVSRVSTLEDRSSSKEFEVALPSVHFSGTSPQTPTAPENRSLESDEFDSSRPGSQGVDSGSDSTDTYPTLTSKSSSDRESNYSSISHEESEISPANPNEDDSNISSMSASSDTKMELKPDSRVKDTETDLSSEVMTDSNNNASVNTDPTYGSIHVSSGKSTDANTATGGMVSVEEDDNASTEANTDSVSIKPTTDYSIKPSDSTVAASIEANPNPKNRLGPNQYAISEENMISLPRKKRPYHFGFLGPISHFFSNQQPINLQTSRKQTRFRVETVTNLAQSSSEETD